MGSISENVMQPYHCKAAVVDFPIAEHVYEVTMVCGDRSNKLRASISPADVQKHARSLHTEPMSPRPTSSGEFEAAKQEKFTELSNAATHLLGAMCVGCPNNVFCGEL